MEGIYRFILAQVRDRQDAEDLASETFARMLRGLDGFRGEASFKNWLYQIARNAVRNHRRSSTYRRVLPLGPEVSDSDVADVADVAAEESEVAATSRLDRALAVLAPLPPRYRQVLELRFIEGRSIEETASLMGATEANVKVLQHRALKKAASHANRSLERTEGASDVASLRDAAALPDTAALPDDAARPGGVG